MNIPNSDYDTWKLQAPEPPPFKCEECEDQGCVHCDPEHDDPTLWCNGCGARAQDDCDCGPIAENN